MLREENAELKKQVAEYYFSNFVVVSAMQELDFEPKQNLTCSRK
jgi:hypothetical protein